MRGTPPPSLPIRTASSLDPPLKIGSQGSFLHSFHRRLAPLLGLLHGTSHSFKLTSGRGCSFQGSFLGQPHLISS